MSAERKALYKAICENPEDDTARLVYADWLDEHGEPDRAEFIRVQIGIAAGDASEPRLADALTRANELFNRNASAWQSELPSCPGVTWATPPFTRGFAGSVGFRHGKAWKEHSETVFAATPVSQLQCGGTFTGKTARPLFASPLLGRLAVLTGIHVDESGAELLAKNAHFNGRLRELHISSTGRGDAPAVTLSRLAGIRNLETLTLGTVGLAGVTAFASSPHLTRLKNFHAGNNLIGDEGAEAIAASPHLAALEHVLLNDTGIGDRGAAALARSERLTSLRELYLGGRNPITDAGALEIAASTGLPRLTDLHLWQSQITDPGARALADFAEKRGLRVLNLRSCNISKPVAKELSARLGTRFAN